MEGFRYCPLKNEAEFEEFTRVMEGSKFSQKPRSYPVLMISYFTPINTKKSHVDHVCLYPHDLKQLFPEGFKVKNFEINGRINV